VASDDEHMSR